MPSHLGYDNGELFPQCRQRPVLDIPGQCQPLQEVRQVVRQGKQLQVGLIVPERPARELGPIRSVLAFLDPLLGGAATVVELHHVLR